MLFSSKTKKKKWIIKIKELEKYEPSVKGLKLKVGGKDKREELLELNNEDQIWIRNQLEFAHKNDEWWLN